MRRQQKNIKGNYNKEGKPEEDKNKYLNQTKRNLIRIKVYFFMKIFS